MSDTTLPYTKKSLGQHWLTDPTSLRAMCDAAEVSEDDTILEVGPGGGTLTKLLLERSRGVVAVELDERLAVNLPSVVGGSDRLTVVRQSILEFDLTTLPADYKVVANIPYYLTSNLIRVLSESRNRPRIAVLLVQKEVAERVAAKPGDMSLLSVSAQYYWEVRTGMEMPAKLFTPPPKVDSQILVLRRRDTPLFGAIDEKVFFRVVRIGYSQRRKTILNTLSSGLRVSKAEAGALCEAARISPTLRPQMLDLQGWYNLYAAYQDFIQRPV